MGGRLEVRRSYINPLFKTKTGPRSFSYRNVNIWNNLPPDIKLSQCLNSFKRHL